MATNYRINGFNIALSCCPIKIAWHVQHESCALQLLINKRPLIELLTEISIKYVNMQYRYNNDCAIVLIPEVRLKRDNDCK